MTRFLSEKDFNLAIYEEIKKTADAIATRHDLCPLDNRRR